MKKGHRIGINKHIGASGEKYISLRKDRIKPTWDVNVILHDGSKKKKCHVGYFKTLEEAVEARDKFLSSL